MPMLQAAAKPMPRVNLTLASETAADDVISEVIRKLTDTPKVANQGRILIGVVTALRYEFLDRLEEVAKAYEEVISMLYAKENPEAEDHTSESEQRSEHESDYVTEMESGT